MDLIFSQKSYTFFYKLCSIQTLRELTQSELDDPTECKIRKEFDIKIESMYGNHVAPPPNWAQRRRRADDDRLEDDPLSVGPR